MLSVVRLVCTVPYYRILLGYASTSVSVFSSIQRMKTYKGYTAKARHSYCPLLSSSSISFGAKYTFSTTFSKQQNGEGQKRDSTCGFLTLSATTGGANAVSGTMSRNLCIFIFKLIFLPH